MAEIKNTIKIEIDGITKYLADVKSIENEIAQIEQGFRKAGLTERAAMVEAEKYRKKMHADIKTAERLELQRIKKVEKEQTQANNKAAKGLKTLNVLGKRFVLGGILIKTIGTIISYFQKLVNKTSETNEGSKKLTETFGRLAKMVESVSLFIIKLVSGPLTWIMNKYMDIGDALAGISKEERNLMNIRAAASTVVIQGLLTEIKLRKELYGVISNTNALWSDRLAAVEKYNEMARELGLLTISLDHSLEERNAIEEANNLYIQERLELEKRGAKWSKEELNAKMKDLKAEQDFRGFALKTDLKRKREAVQKLTKEELEARQKIGKLTELEQRRLDELNKGQEAVNTKLQKRLDWLEKIKKANQEIVTTSVGVSGDIQGDIDKAINAGELAKAEILLEELKKSLIAFDADTAKFKSGETTVSELERERVGLVAELELNKKVHEKHIASVTGIYEGFVKNGELHTRVYADRFTKGMTEAQRKAFNETYEVDADGIFKLFEGDPTEIKKKFQKILADYKSGAIKTSAEIAQAMDKLSVTDLVTPASKKKVDESKATLDKLNADLAEAKKIVTKYGVESESERDKIIENILKSESDIAEKRLRIQEDINERLQKLATEYYEALLLAGEATIFDAQEEALIRQSLAINNAKKEIEGLNEQLTKFAGEKVLEIDYTRGNISSKQVGDTEGHSEAINEINIQLNLLKNMYSSFSEESEQSAKELTKRLLESFKKRYAEELSLLEFNLEKQILVLNNAYAEREYQEKIFKAKAKKEGRELNDEEINTLNLLTDRILMAESKRYALEYELRVGAFMKELELIAKQGGDIERAKNEYLLKELKLLNEHYTTMQKIAEENSVDIEIPVKIDFLSAGQDIANGFMSLFAEVMNLQEMISQSIIDRLRENVENIDSLISESLENVSKLEDDLEGKRSGRRDALLRGIELEKEREVALNKKKMELEKKMAVEKKKANEAQQAASISQAIIQGALGIVGIWSQSLTQLGPIAGPIIAGVLTASMVGVTAFNVASIASQKFADGGLLEGASHRNGGIPFTIDGKPGFEAEGGEAIMSKRTVARFGHELNEMQISTGSKALFENGGILSKDLNHAGLNQTFNRNPMKSLDNISNQKIYVSVTDIQNQMGKKATIVQNTSI